MVHCCEVAPSQALNESDDLVAAVPASRQLFGELFIAMVQLAPAAVKMSCELARLLDIACCTTGFDARSMTIGLARVSRE